MLDDVRNIAGLGLQENLDVGWLNHQAIANNIANANTPGFKGSHVVFKKKPTLNPVLELVRTQSTHLTEMLPKIPPQAQVESVGTVNLDAEMAEMAKNNLFFQTLLEAVQRRDHMARSAIEGR